MRWFTIFLLTVIITFALSSRYDDNEKWPTVGISILVRNKVYSLPYFFSCIENLDYPKERIYIWIWTDYNVDHSEVLIDYWVNLNQDNYNGVYVKHNDTTGPTYVGETSPTQWTLARFKNVMRLRENALFVARQKWADYHLMLDADVYLTNPRIIKQLILKEYPVIAPMLRSDGMYSNFWAAMSEGKYFKRSKDYQAIVEGKNVGCFDVPMIHSAVLINMNNPKSDQFTYDMNKLFNYKGPIDDIVVFASSVAAQEEKMLVCNEFEGGYVQVPLDAGDDLKKDLDHLINVKLLALAEEKEIPLNENLKAFVTYPEPTKFGMDEIFMINLDRRETRRTYMQKCFREIGMDVQTFEAFDGLSLNMQRLPFNIRLMPGYEDPYHKRPMKAGEIGCFLSHYSIWKEMVEKNYKTVLILEDDVYFRPFFRQNMEKLMADVKDGDWELLYIGRKILSESEEKRVSPLTVVPSYSYWTLGYVLTGEGARKLLAADPLKNMLPVDEFLPIMFDKHPNDTWKNSFPVRNLKALSSNPLLIEPIRYVNQPGYVSDTESSPIVDPLSGRFLNPDIETEIEPEEEPNYGMSQSIVYPKEDVLDEDMFFTTSDGRIHYTEVDDNEDREPARMGHKMEL